MYFPSDRFHFEVNNDCKGHKGKSHKCNKHIIMNQRFQVRNEAFANVKDFSELKELRDQRYSEKRKSSRLEAFAQFRKRISPEEPYLTELTLPESIQKIFSSNVSDNISGAHYIRKRLGLDFSPPIQELIDSGAIPVLISFIRRFDCPDLQYEAAWALSNIASGEQQHTKIIVERGAVPLIIDLLSSPHNYIKEQGIWVLGNISGDLSCYSDLICQHGGIQKLVETIENTECEDLIKPAVWALSNICKGEKAPEFQLIRHALSTFCKLLSKNDEEILQSCLWVISSITEHSEEAGNLVIAEGVLGRIIGFLKHSEYNIQMPTILIIGHIAAGNDLQTSEVILSGALENLIPLLDSPKRDIRKESLWCFSNISAGSEGHIASMIAAKVFAKVIRILYRDDKEVKIEALWTLANAAGKGNKEQVSQLVKSGIISGLVHCMSVKDPQFILVVLLGIQQVLKSGKEYLTESGANPYSVIFEESGGVVCLEQLQQHHNSKVFEEAYKLLTGYFDAKSEDQDLLDIIASSANY